MHFPRFTFRVQVEPASHITENRSTPPAREAAPLPATLDWHRDLAKWVAAAAAAVISFGLSYLGQEHNATSRVLFSSASVLLVSSLASAFALHTWVIEFGKLWEQRGQIPSTNQKALAGNRAARKKLTTRSSIAYWMMVIAFCGGVAVLAFACAARMWRSQSEHYYSVTHGPDGEMFLTDSATGETWHAVRTPHGAVWRLAVEKRR